MKFHIPIAALDQHIAILGKTGSGKSYAAKGIVEHVLHAKRQTCVIDPTGAWWGLRLAADGKGKGLDVVLLGGEHADVPLAERSGAAVARLVTEQGASVVIDTSGFTVGEYTRWFIDFAGALYTTLRNPLHLVIDEAHYFMPQTGGRVDVDTGKMIHAGNRLMSGGRSRGVRGMLITQRPAKLHKDSLTCADTLIAMRVTAPQDRGAYEDWIEGCGDAKKGKAVIESLATLKRGEGWVWYPEGEFLERIQFPTITTYDSSTAPKHGSKAAPKVGEIDLAEVNKALADAVKEAEANDPKLLRKQVADLKVQLAKRPAATPERIVEKQIGRPEDARTIQTLRRGMEQAMKIIAQINATGFEAVGIDPELVKKAVQSAADQIVKAAEQGLAKRAGEFEKLKKEAAALLSRLQKLISNEDLNVKVDVKHNEPFTVNASPERNGKHIAAREPADGLNGPQQAILDTILMLNTRGIDANRDSVARWLDIHPNGGSYGTNLGYLRSNGYLSGCTLTDSGREAAHEQETGLDAALRALEDEPKRNILRTLIDAGQPLTRDELAERLGLHPKGGSYGTNIGRLRTMGLITERGPIAPTEGLYR